MTGGHEAARDLFAEIRERISAEEAARFYGLEISKGKARCIFHSDRHPSMSFRNGRFRCWACGATGTALDLVMQLYGLTVTEAAQRLNKDFQLGIETDRPTDKAAQRERMELAEEHRRFEAWREDFIRRLNAVYRRGHFALLSGGEINDADAEAVQRMAIAEHLADTLSFGSPEEQAAIYRGRKQTEKWIDKILKD